MQHSQFIIDGVNYQLSSNCESKHFNIMCEKVQKFLIIHGKEAAKSMFGQASALGKIKMCGCLLTFKLTINPQGIQL